MAMAMRTDMPASKVGAIARPASVDDAVVAGCVRQDPTAFRSFVVRHQNMVFALLSRMLGRGPEVEDLAQEAFVRAFRAFPTFDLHGVAKPSTWLLTIATRLALDARRKKKLAVIDTAELDEVAGSEVTPERALERRELGLALEKMAMTLPDDQRAVLLLCEVHGLSVSEIAAALEVPEATAKTRLFRAREKMRAALPEEWRTP